MKEFKKEPDKDIKEYKHVYIAGLKNGPGFSVNIYATSRHDKEIIKKCQKQFGNFFFGLYIDKVDDAHYLFTNPHWCLYNKETDKKRNRHPRYIEDENGEIIDTWKKVLD